MYRSIGVLASLACTAAMFVGVSAAQAQGEAAVCIFTGLSGNLSKELPNLDNTGDSITLPPGAPLSGEYNFSGRGNCAGVDDQEGPFLPDTDPIDPRAANWGNVTIASKGDYENYVCGNGWAHGDEGVSDTTVTPDAGIDTPLGGVPDAIDDIEYEILFAGGNGPLLIGKPPLDPDDTQEDSDRGSWVGGGAVHITPADPFPLGVGGNCVTDLDPSDDHDDNDEDPDDDSVSSFTVAGGFSAVSG